MILYKYLQKEHLVYFRETGLIYVNTLHNLRIENEGIRDEQEGIMQHTVEAGTPLLSVRGSEANLILPNIPKKFDTPYTIDSGIPVSISSKVQVADVFVFCTSRTHNINRGQKLGYSAYYKIVDPEEFAIALFKKLDEKFVLQCFDARPVNYSNKEYRVTKESIDASTQKNSKQRLFWEICFSKPLSFKYEKEFRMVFVPMFSKVIKPCLLNCPELLQYCEF